MIANFKGNAYRWSLSAGVVIFLVGFVALTDAATIERAEVTHAQAELMGRVEHFFMNNFRDVTWRKSVEWGQVQTHSDGSRSIRYKYRARIWDKKTTMMNQMFTFDKNGKYIRYENVEGFPMEEKKKVVDISSKKGMQALVEDFFTNNFRDVTSQEMIEWGDVVKLENGNSSIRYKYLATIWHKDKKIINQVFTFDPNGEFVSVKDVTDSPQEGNKSSQLDLSSPEATVRAFTKAAASGDIESALACVAIDGHDYGDIKEVLTRPGDPVKNPLKDLLEATDIDSPITVKKDVKGNRCEIKWTVILDRAVTINKGGKPFTFKAGDTFAWDGNLKKVGDRWLIVGI